MNRSPSADRFSMTADDSIASPATLDELDLDSLRLGEVAREIRLVTRADNQRVAAALVGQAVRSLEIFSRDLEAEIYDQPDFIAGIRALALNSRHARIRILLQDASRVARDGHRLLEIARRLSSYIEIRRPSHEYREYNEAFMLVDGTGLIHRHNADRHEGSASFRQPLRARELGNFFEEVWQRSSPHPDLQRLHI
jgi:hypothetical protein